MSQSNEEENKPAWVDYFKVSFDYYNGYVNTIAEANDLVREYELATTTSYVSSRDTGKFGENADITKTKHRVFWQDAQKSGGPKLEFDGEPFMILGCKVLECRHGPDRNKALKAKNMADKQECVKRRRVFKNTIKFGCPASITLREVLKFPKYKIDKNTKGKREYSSRMLRNNMESSGHLDVDHRIYVLLPKTSDHWNHIIGRASGLMQQVDREVIKHIHEMVEDGVRSVEEMERHLRYFVKAQMFAGRTPPDISNRRFFPTKTDIRNHMYRANVSQRMTKKMCL